MGNLCLRLTRPTARTIRSMEYIINTLIHVNNAPLRLLYHMTWRSLFLAEIRWLLSRDEAAANKYFIDRTPGFGYWFMHSIYSKPVYENCDDLSPQTSVSVQIKTDTVQYSMIFR